MAYNQNQNEIDQTDVVDRLEIELNEEFEYTYALIEYLEMCNEVGEWL